MYWLVGFMVFNATFNNISIIYIVVSFIVGGNLKCLQKCSSRTFSYLEPIRTISFHDDCPINTPPTCYVGVWKLQVETIKKADNKNIIFEYTHDQDIYVLFNPWCESED
jgi:hypothetical protein